ncbi:hypothetical protein KY331_05370 [Candidatus Woesearchaeota archaeon]|nr:hypothetical protein [Candidatus Woesearchaeota archaeon]
MAKTCTNCGKKIRMFVTPEADEQGNVVCKECVEKKKIEQEAAQKQREELESKAKLAKALSNNSQWEYKVINLNITGSEDELTNFGLEGWNLVSAIALNSAAAKPSENLEGEKKEENPEQQQPQPPQPPQPASQPEAQPSSDKMVCIFKRKL